MTEKKVNPPRRIISLLRRFCPDHLVEEIEGDLIQRFQRDFERYGGSRARRRFLWHTMQFFRPGIILRNKFKFSLVPNLMFRNYIKVAFRGIARSKGFSAINITGLTAGIACTVLILLWIENELSYDRFHHDSERLYEAWNRDVLDGEVSCWNTTPRILAPTIKSEYPEVEEAISFADYEMEFLVTKDNVRFMDKSGMITASGFLSMFNFPLLSGDPKTALDQPFSIVMTKSFAEKIFNTPDVLGKDVTLRYGSDAINFTVTGVLEDLPNNTAFDFGYLLSWELMRAMGESDTFWGNNSLRTFIKLKGNVSLETFNSKIRDIVKRHTNGAQKNEVFLYPVSRQRLYSHFVNGTPEGGRIDVVQLFGVIAFFIMLISCINFMNLSTARSENRAREVGIRKTIGAQQRSLIGQFLTESMLIAFFAGFAALIAIHLLLPTFNLLTEKSLVLDYTAPKYWMLIGFVTLFAGFMAGSYPAFFLSSFKPVRVLKGNYISVRSGATVRKTLVIFQFAFTIILAIATLVVTDQINFAQARETGYAKDNLIYHSVTGDIAKNFAAYKSELLTSGVALSISQTFSPITEQWSSTPALEWQGQDPNTQIVFDRYAADEGLVRTAGLELIAGRDLDLSQFPSDSSAALINETAARVMNFKDPVGETFRDSGKEWKIVGMIKDFVARSPFQQTAPMVIEGSKSMWFYAIHIRLANSKPLSESLAAAETIFKKYNPDFPFEYHFADVEYDRKFSDEKRIQKLSGVSGSLTIFISCLGILGLSIHMARARLKEIGIRKVFGASVWHVLTMLLKEPARLVFIAFVLACPIAWWGMTHWLERFEYKVNVGWWVFAFTGAGTMALALLTSGIQVLRSARANPVRTLKYE